MRFDLVVTPQGRRISRISGIAALALLAAAALVLGWRLMGSVTDEAFSEHAATLIEGARLTVFITAATTLPGLVLATLLAAVRLAGPRALAGGAAAFGLLFRGTPLLAQLYLVYYGSGDLSAWLRSAGLWWFFRDPLNCVILVFTLNTAAYQAEALYGAVRSLPREQSEAARALGLGVWQTYRLVLLPQALRLALRPLGNEWSKMLRASALASIVTVVDLLGAGRVIYSETFNFDIYILIALIFVVAVEILRRGIDALDRRLALAT